MKAFFKLPNTQFCFVVWYRPNKGTTVPRKRKEIRLATPANNDMLQSELLKHRVGLSEVRAVKADLASPLKEIAVSVNPIGLASAMTRLAA